MAKASAKPASRAQACQEGFRKAVTQALEDPACYQPGLRALAKGARKHVDATRVHLAGSVALDDCVASREPRASRWDYLVGACQEQERCLYGIEVHQVDARALANKLAWVKTWLQRHGRPLLRWARGKVVYYLVPTPRGSARAAEVRRLAQLGLRIARRVSLTCPPEATRRQA